MTSYVDVIDRSGTPEEDKSYVRQMLIKKLYKNDKWLLQKVIFVI